MIKIGRAQTPSFGAELAGLFAGGWDYVLLVAILDRLCPAPEQEQVLRMHCGHARYVGNLAVEQQSWWWPGRGRAPGYVDQARQLAEARAAFLPNGARAKAGLSKAILASCWGTLGRRLAEKGAASGVSVLFADPRFTSQQCHARGRTQAQNRESQAVFRCQECGHHDHADRNAARNILARGLATLGGQVPARAPGHGAPRPRQPPASAGAAGITRSAA